MSAFSGSEMSHSILCLLSTVRDVTGTVSDRCSLCPASSGVLCSLQLWKELTAVVAAGSCGMLQLLECGCVVWCSELEA